MNDSDYVNINGRSFILQVGRYTKHYFCNKHTVTYNHNIIR